MVAIKICVIGDGFKEFGSLSGVMTYSAFQEWAKLFVNSNECALVYFGQGLSPEEKRTIKSVIEESRRTLIAGANLQEACSSALTHKQIAANIVISEPKKCNNEEAFEAWLVVDDACAEMSDHVTGEHLQGTLIAEAARQMVLAVNEKFSCQSQKGSVSFVTHSTELKYLDYLFPLPVKLVYRNVSLRRGLNGNYRAIAAIEFYQGGKNHATCTFSFSVFEKKFIAEQERNLALGAIQKILAEETNCVQ